MAFDCPSCNGEGTLKITHKIELMPDLAEWCDELTLQTVACSACEFRGAALYEESRRGASESIQHDCFRVEDKALTRLIELIQTCPDPENKRCQCNAHRIISARDANGKWLCPVECMDGEFPHQMKFRQ